jgi:hypothetical protein
MQAHLVRWDAAYRGQGLTILYVGDGRRVDRERLDAIMRADGATFATAVDPQGATTQAYGVRAYPTAYILGRDGRVVWEGIPHYNPAAVEAALRTALAAR